ncbi:MAG TPA: CoA pyrophosphatase [Longimicrobiales bacterium]
MDDRRLIQLQQLLETHPVVPQLRDDGMREAAVALILRPRDELELLLIKRAVHERDPWSGHVALPGGRRDALDADLVDTAVRESHEEVGITISRDTDLIGALDEVAPRTPRLPPILIAPFVFAAPATASARIDAREVEAALWVPLSALRDENAVSEILIELEGDADSRRFPALKYGEYVIWGLTHRILEQFLEIAEGL